MKKRILVILFIAVTVSGTLAQQLPILDNYLVNPVALSPAFTGKYHPFEMYVTHRSDWTGLNGSPVAGFISADGMLTRKMGLGGSILLNKADIFKNFAVNLNYAYHLQLAKEHFLSFGVNASMYQNSVDFADAVVEDPLDPMFYDRDFITETYFNAGIGILYNWKALNVCISSPVLFNNKSLYQPSAYDQVLTLDQNWLIYANYSLMLAADWKLKFDLLFRDTQYSPWTVDFSAMVKYQDNYWLGMLYRKNNILGVTAGLAIAGSVVINYNFEFSGTSMMGQGGGIHEVTLGYRLLKPQDKKTDTPQIIDYRH
jgi:type IX secretion system PorP/SprF family membrane protein